jgi:glycosyltransferase involved in cell wall biosynthesis
MSNFPPDISVIIPFYNPGEAFRRCLDSVLGQTKKNLEVIIVNDGSTDVSVEIGREYKKAHPQICLLEGPNQGVSVAYNRGLDTATGKYIYFCDADDYIAPELCEFLYSRMESSQAQLATCALLRGANLDELLCTIPSGEDEIWDSEKILRDWYLPMQRGTSYHRVEARGYLPGCMFRRDLIEREKIRLIPGLSMNEDEVFIMEYLIYVKKAILSNRPLYYYCYSDNSLCASYFVHKRISQEKRRNDFLLRSEKNRIVFEKSGLTEEYPGLHAELLVNEVYHRLQKIAISRDRSFREKFRASAEIIQQLKSSPAWTVLRKNAGLLPFGKKLFFRSLQCGTIATLTFCAVARLRRKE